MASITAIKLSKDDLGQLLSKLYPARAKWQNLGLCLGLHSDSLDAIKLQYSNRPDDCLREMLKLWLSSSTPQKEDLIKALKALPIGYESLAVELIRWVPSSPAPLSHNNKLSAQPTLESAVVKQKKQPEVSATSVVEAKSAATASDSSTQTDLSSPAAITESLPSKGLAPEQQESLEFRIQDDVDKMKKDFSILQSKTRLSMEKNGVTAQKVATHVIEFGIEKASKDTFERAESFDDVFRELAKCWTFLDCDLLDSIVEVYGTDEDHSRMKKHLQKLEEFCKRRVSELPTNIFPLSGGGESQLQTAIKRDQLTIKWVHDDNPRLCDIKLIKRKICNILNIDPATLEIKSIGRGCVKITFLIFEDVSKRLFNKPLSETQCDAFRSASILSLSCGDYQEVFTKTIMPGKPGKPRALLVTSNSIQIEWKMPENNAELTKYFTIFYHSRQSYQDEWKEVNTREANVVLGSLLPNQEYVFKVCPTSETGPGPESDLSDPIRTKPLTPGRPGKPTPMSITSDTIHLEWSQPYFNAHLITSYTISYRSFSNASSEWKYITSEENAVVLHNLSPNSTYICKVRPESDGGPGIISDTIVANLNDSFCRTNLQILQDLCLFCRTFE